MGGGTAVITTSRLGTLVGRGWWRLPALSRYTDTAEISTQLSSSVSHCQTGGVCLSGSLAGQASSGEVLRNTEYVMLRV